MLPEFLDNFNYELWKQLDVVEESNIKLYEINNFIFKCVSNPLSKAEIFERARKKITEHLTNLRQHNFIVHRLKIFPKSLVMRCQTPFRQDIFNCNLGKTTIDCHKNGSYGDMLFDIKLKKPRKRLKGVKEGWMVK